MPLKTVSKRNPVQPESASSFFFRIVFFSSIPRVIESLMFLVYHAMYNFQNISYDERKNRMKIKNFFLMCLSVFSSTLFFISAKQVSADVRINEIAWMGIAGNPNGEWVELYNNGSAKSLTGWSITAEDGTPTIHLSGNIPSQGFFLLERTSDNTLLGISADLIYTGALEDSGE